jgi:putative transposase
MSGFAFRTGLAFELNGVPHRIVRLPPNDQVVIERESDGQITVSERDDLLASYRQGMVATKRTEVSASRVINYGRPIQDLPAHVLSELKRRAAYVEAIEESGPCVFTPHYLIPVLRDAALKLGDDKPPSVSTFYRWYRRYRAHHELRSLVPRYDLRGRRVVAQADRVLELAEEATKEAFEASPAASGRAIYDRLAGKIKVENQRRSPHQQLVTPSLRTVYRLLNRIEAYDLHVMKDGKASADRRFRIVGAGVKVSDILERVEMDHTPLDLFLVDDATALPLGRPILTLLIDVYSRFPLGYFLNFGGASTTAVMGALRNAVLPKQQAKEAIPGLHVHHKWPCYGLMDTLVLDNGLEFHSDDLESVAFDLGIGLLFCPKKQPRFKGVIERFLKTVNYSFAHQLPGTSLARMSQRGDYDPEKHAVLTMSEFQHLFEKWLLDVYAQTVHRGLGTTPWAKWHEGGAKRTPELPYSIKDLQRRIGLVRERSLRHDGITIDGNQYSGNMLDPVIKKWGVGIRVRVVFDPQDLGSIQIWPPDVQDPIEVPAVDLGYAGGLTMNQHELIRQRVREKGLSDQDPKALADAKYEIALEADGMLKSRKQRNRRRAAHMHGKTSDRPLARLVAEKNKSTASRVVEPMPFPESPRSEVELTRSLIPLLPPFALT